MYQSIYYDRTTYEYHLRDDVKGWKTFKYQPTLYQLDPDGEFETLDGQSVSPVKKMDNWKDPKYFENTVKLDQISFKEAIELSYYGASVIHPKTIKPLQNKFCYG